MKSQAYDKIADAIIAKIEAGEADPWRRPWTTEPARNLKNAIPYSGVNAWLGMVGRYFVTFRQAAELHNSFDRYKTVVKKKRNGDEYEKRIAIDGAGRELKPCAGLKGLPVLFRKNTYTLDGHEVKWQEVRALEDLAGTQSLTGLKRALAGDGRKLEIRNVKRLYYVFNIDDLPASGDYERYVPAAQRDEVIPIRECLKTLRGIPNKPIITHRRRGDGRDCYYRPSEDTVNIPYAKNFDDIEAYYATIFHELVHATGHEDRLGRFKDEDHAAFGSNDHSREELIAEFGAAMLCGRCGIDTTLSNSTNYIAAWLKRIKDDKGILPMAIEKAAKAVEYIRDGYDNKKILESKPAPEPEPKPDATPAETPSAVAIVKRTDIKKTLELLKKCLPKSKPTLPCLSAVLVRGQKGTITLTATNLYQRLTITHTAPFGGEFEYLADVKIMTALLKGKSKMVSFNGPAPDAIEIPAANIDIDDYPNPAPMTGDVHATLTPSMVSDMACAAKCGATDDKRKVLHGVLLNGNGHIIGCDGKRMFIGHIPKANNVWDIIIPRPAIKVITALKAKSNIQMSANMEKHQAEFAAAGVCLHTKLIEGQYPDYKRVIPSGLKHTAVISATELEELKSALQPCAAAAAKARESNKYVKLTSECGGPLTIAMKTDDIDYERTISLVFPSAVKMSFNPRLLLDGLECGLEEIRYSDATMPTMFCRDGEARYVIMPMHK